MTSFEEERSIRKEMENFFRYRKEIDPFLNPQLKR